MGLPRKQSFPEPLTGADRADWEVLARGHNAYFETKVSDDSYVDPEVRRRGVATAMIKWVAWDAEEHGAPRLYWNTLDNFPARALYDKVANFNKGLILYTYRRDANQSSAQR